MIAVSFLKPEDELDLLVGDWSFDNYKVTVVMELFLDMLGVMFFFFFFVFMSSDPR